MPIVSKMMKIISNKEISEEAIIANDFWYLFGLFTASSLLDNISLILANSRR